MSAAHTILLLGRCGLERLADPLRAATGAHVTVAGWTQVNMVERLRPDLVYVDLFGWDLIGPLIAAALRDQPIDVDDTPLKAVIQALSDNPNVVFRGLRRPSAGAWGLLQHHTTLGDALDALAALVAPHRVLDVAGLWARSAIPLDDVRFGMGHGEAGMAGAEQEAAWLHALWHARVHGPVKCIVVDLDDTLFHGKLADDAFHDANPAYLPTGEDARKPLLEGWWRLKRGLHEALRIAARRGIVLAVATRNDPAVVQARWRKRPAVADRNPGLYAWMYDDLPDTMRDTAFEQHPQILDALALGPDDVVHIEAGFGAKSDMCRRIARRLGIGLNTLAFFDDSPFERAEVREHAPDVLVIDTPVEDFRHVLLHGPQFTVWDISPAARKRHASYRSRAAVDARTATPRANVHDFLKDLELHVEVRPAHLGDLYRVNELIQRTNQLNLTGARVALDTAEDVYVASCRDRLADHGVISAGVVRDARWVVWVCSCRVLPHQVAATILWAMQQYHPRAQVKRVETPRNGATVGLIDEARRGPAPWVSLKRRE